MMWKGRMDDPIKDYFAFEENDLLANRDGKLSEKQSKHIKKADRFAERFVAGLFLVFIVGGIFVGILAFSARNNIALWAGTIVLLLIAVWAFRGIRTEVDDTVQKVQGEVNFVKAGKKTDSADDSSTGPRKAPGYEMQVGSEVFANVNPALVEYMQGNTYTVYFTKTTRQILSVEPVSEATDTKDTDTTDAGTKDTDTTEA